MAQPKYKQFDLTEAARDTSSLIDNVFVLCHNAMTERSIISDHNLFSFGPDFEAFRATFFGEAVLCKVVDAFHSYVKRMLLAISASFPAEVAETNLGTAQYGGVRGWKCLSRLAGIPRDLEIEFLCVERNAIVHEGGLSASEKSFRHRREFDNTFLGVGLSFDSDGRVRHGFLSAWLISGAMDEKVVALDARISRHFRLPTLALARQINRSFPIPMDNLRDTLKTSPSTDK